MAHSPSDSWHTALFEAGPDAMLVLDDAGRCVDVNQAVCEILGASREALVGGLADALVVKGARHSFASLAGATAFAGEFSLGAADGRAVAFDWRARANFVPGLHVWIGRDVTQRQRVREAEEEYRQWLRTTLASIGDAVITTDVHGLVTMMNPVAERLTGWSEAEALGSPLASVFRIVNELTRGAVDNPIDIVLRDGVVVGVANHTVLVRRDGTEVAIDDSAAPIPDASGGVVGVVLIFRDVTERRQHALDAERLAAIVESSDDAILAKDLHGVITSWNSGAERIFGYTAEEVVGRSIQILVPKDRPDEEPSILRRLRAGERVDHYETVRVRKDGTRIDASVTISPIKDSDGVVVGASKVARDISREKALRKELEHRVAELAATDRRKDEFLAMLAHELRNPMGAMSNAVQVLRQTDDAVIRERAEQVLRRQVQHQARIVNELLDVSRVSRGLIELHFEDLDAASLVRDTVDDYRGTMEREGIDLTVQIADGPLWVRADRTRLVQVITNLLTNALKFTKAGGHVTVTVARSPVRSRVEITVADTGIGIEAELLPHVFESFAHGDRSLARTQGGLGLGLAIVKGLVELHEGEVSITSEGPGRGTTVRVELPARVRTGEVAVHTGDASRRRSLRILVVEDNRDAAEMLADLLSLQGHQVDVALTGAEGVRMARENHPDLVLCDLGLPGMNGFEVAAALRIAPGGARQRLIAVTGYGQEEDRRRSREAGFHDHLVKPIGPDELQRVLSTVAEGLER